MIKKTLFILALSPHLLFAQTTVQLTKSPPEILYILQMNSEEIGLNKNLELKLDRFKLHSLSGGDSLIVSVLNDSTLYNINPDYIKEVTLFKNTPKINLYTSEKVKGVVIFKFKNKDQYLSIISN